jgi:hypothetical protein
MSGPDEPDDSFWIAEAEKERLLENEYKLGDVIGRLVYISQKLLLL